MDNDTIEENINETFKTKLATLTYDNAISIINRYSICIIFKFFWYLNVKINFLF